MKEQLYARNVTYSECKSFNSELGTEDLEDQINRYCNATDTVLEGISYSFAEIQVGVVRKLTSNSAPIYNRVVLYSAIIFYTKRK